MHEETCFFTVRVLQPRPPGKIFRKLTNSVRGMKQSISHKLRVSSTRKFKTTTFIDFLTCRKTQQYIFIRTSIKTQYEFPS